MLDQNSKQHEENTMEQKQHDEEYKIGTETAETISSSDDLVAGSQHVEGRRRLLQLNDLISMLMDAVHAPVRQR